MSDIMSFQKNVLRYEMENNIAKYIVDDSCKDSVYFTYKQGAPKQCKISGTTLCKSGELCYQKEAIDGILGPQTKSAFEKYKGEKPVDQDKTFEEIYSDYSTTDEKWDQIHTQNWQIPAEMDNIKAFQYYVWKKIEKDNEKEANCSKSPCAYKSILCGNNFCKVDKAVDGFWGENTKIAWNKYKENYYDDGYSVGSGYDELFETYKDL